MLYQGRFPMNYSWNLEIALAEDLQGMFYEQLKREGYSNVDPERATYQYFNIQKRAVSRRPRRVHRSREFVCPQAYEKALQEFEHKVERGESLIPFLSDQLKDASRQDGMLNDWNIYHFHLTRRMRPDGWAKRSDYEIFAYVTEQDLYLIQVYEHRDSLLYCRREVVRILYDNWPELMEPFLLRGVSQTEHLNDEQYKTLREAHISTFVEVDGKVFGLLGGGYMGDGSSGEAVHREHRWHNWLGVIQYHLVQNMPVICRMMGQNPRDIGRYRIKLFGMKDQQHVALFEENQRVVIFWNLEERFFKLCEYRQMIQHGLELSEMTGKRRMNHGKCEWTFWDSTTLCP